jgi:lysophospholipid acyltransferase (LPLAT)-like uncharacterized protein
MLKTLLGNPVFQYVVGRAIGFYMLFVGVTTRWQRVNQAAIEPFWRGEGKLIGCIWHGRFTLIHKMWKFGRGAPPAKMLISRSREGGLVSWVSRTVGAEVIRGSAAKRGQQKGGVEATLQMARHLDGGGVIAMTPDGPRGPRMRVKKGAVQLARIAGASLMGVTWATSNRIVFQGSWDKFVFPLPFGRGALIWTDPIPVPADADDETMERLRLKLETEMNRIAAEADRIAGIAVIEPAPPRAAMEHIDGEEPVVSAT